MVNSNCDKDNAYNNSMSKRCNNIRISLELMDDNESWRL
jgi:hypothetical protein